MYADRHYFEIHYGSGQMDGTVDKDVVCFGYGNEADFCTNKEQGFACALHEPALAFIFAQFDGILGMAWDAISVNGIAQPMTQIFDHPACEEKLFAFWLNRNGGDSKTGGEMTLCGTDPAHYVGEIFWIPLIAADYWRVGLNALKVGGREVITHSHAVLDTGSSVLVGPIVQVRLVQQEIGAVELLPGEYFVLCSLVSMLPDIHIVLNGMDYKLRPEEYIIKISQDGVDMCIVGIIGLEFPAGMDPFWILGDSFIGQYYSVFDHENQRIGLATAK